MHMLSCIIVDDEPLAIDVLKKYVARTQFLKLIEGFTNPLEALSFFKNDHADLVFLDIEMEQLSGIQFMQMLPGDVQVIIVSAYSQYAIEGYEYDVVGYLLKPVDYEKFFALAQKAFRFNKGRNRKLLTEYSPADFSKYIFIKEDDVIVKVNTHDILYVEGMRNYLCVQTTAKKFITYSSMKSMQAVLHPDAFYRVHKSFIIALDKIDSIERNRIHIGGQIIPVGETYAHDFFKLLESRRP
jgi:two-component system LytT family response regulator